MLITKLLYCCVKRRYVTKFCDVTPTKKCKKDNISLDTGMLYQWYVISISTDNQSPTHYSTQAINQLNVPLIYRQLETEL